MQARLRRGDRRPAAQDPAQQFPRLLHRDAAGAGRGAPQTAAQRDLHPSPDHGRGAALHHQRARRARGEDRLGRRPGARSSNSKPSSGCARPASPRATPCAPSAPRSPRSTSRRRWPSSRSNATGRGPLVDASLAFRIEGGRHPVVEAALKAAGEPFVANACDLSGEVADGGRIAVVTGPNMAGKSTYLRQNALIALLAQMGSYVPGRAAPISAWSTGCSPASAPPTISPAAARPSWSRWSRRRRSSTRRRSARWSSSTRSAAARRRSTASRSPTPASST